MCFQVLEEYAVGRKIVTESWYVQDEDLALFSLNTYLEYSIEEMYLFHKSMVYIYLHTSGIPCIDFIVVALSFFIITWLCPVSIDN